MKTESPKVALDAVEADVTSSKPSNNGSEVYDPFDPKNLRIDQDHLHAPAVKKRIASIKVAKPHNQEFIRVNPDPDYCTDAAILTLKDTGEIYLVPPQMTPYFRPGELRHIYLYCYITRAGTLKLWPIPVGTSGVGAEWNESAKSAAHEAMEDWIQIQSNRESSSYETFHAGYDLGEPEWPDLTFKEFLRLAFKERFIDSPNHNVYKELRAAP